MLAPKLVVLNEARCPVDEKELTRYTSQPTKDTIAIAAGLPLMQRARLCQFCYSKAHLHTLALHLASTCDQPTLQPAVIDKPPAIPEGDPLYHVNLTLLDYLTVLKRL